MSSIDCDRMRAQLFAYLDGEACEDARDLIEDHISNCQHCQAAAGYEEAVRKLIKRSCCEPCPQELREKITTSIRIQISTYSTGE